MMAAEKQTLLRGELLHDEPMSRHTSLRVGGAARVWFRPADRDDLVLFLAGLPANEPLYWVGLGSNLLVRDGGLDGTVIAMQGRLADIHMHADDNRVLYAEAGVTCARVARLAAREGLTGAEFLAGIPGTMGGALAMNAGAYGHETWERARRVETVDRRGRVHIRTPEDFDIGYRHVSQPNEEWFLSAELVLDPNPDDDGRERIKDLLRKRADTQPITRPTCGSVFRNPPGDHAARLIESAGLKGFCVGGACVSEKHANFIENTGEACAADVEALIASVMDTVERKHGVRLIPEVHMVGRPVA